jgi:hypothetical protein
VSAWAAALSFGIGGKTREVMATELTVQLRRRSDNTTVWEGRAVTESVSGKPGSDPRDQAAQRLANALFRDFPGESASLSRSNEHPDQRRVRRRQYPRGGIEGDRVDLEIVKDHLSDFYQWFHFRLAGAKGRTLTFRILNAGGAAYPFGWPGYKTRWSTDRENVADDRFTDYADGVLSFTRTIDTDIVWFAYFAPYSMERHHDLVSRIAAQPGVSPPRAWA